MHVDLLVDNQDFFSMALINLSDTLLSNRYITGTTPAFMNRLYTLLYVSANSGPVLLWHGCAKITFES